MWELVEPPPGRNIVGSKWVFRVKYKSDGTIERFKARLVAKGYSQIPGLDYDETFSPVVRFPSIRALLAYAVENNMLVHQMDVVTAFLNGNLDEDIYMSQPDGYVRPGEEHLVCKLKKSLYGLKQSSRCWNRALSDYLESLGFAQSSADPCVYVKSSDPMVIIAVYVDDLPILAKTEADMTNVKNCLASQFKMKDLGEFRYCLGVSAEWSGDRSSLWLHQKQFVQNLIKKHGLQDAKVVSTPLDVSVRLEKDDGVSKPVDAAIYQSIVGGLMYASTATRPDISFAVGVLSKFCSKPNMTHLTAAKRVLRYLKGTSDLALKYVRTERSTLLGYSDADWAGDLDDRHSTTGNLFMMAGGAISWMSKKQATVALSTAEAEYVALSAATQEAVWLRRLLTDLEVVQDEPTVLMGDNQGSIAMARNPIAHSRTKHIDIRYHYIREALRDGVVDLRFCPSSEMLADLLTKALSKNTFVRLRLSMGMEQTTVN